MGHRRRRLETRFEVQFILVENRRTGAPRFKGIEFSGSKPFSLSTRSSCETVPICPTYESCSSSRIARLQKRYCSCVCTIPTRCCLSLPTIWGMATACAASALPSSDASARSRRSTMSTVQNVPAMRRKPSPVSVHPSRCGANQLDRYSLTGRRGGPLSVSGSGPLLRPRPRP